MKRCATGACGIDSRANAFFTFGYCRAAKGGQMAYTQQLHAQLAHNLQRRRRALASFLGAAVTGATLLTTSMGCTVINGVSQSLQNTECIDDFVISYRNSAIAAKTWHEQKHCFSNQKHIKHFEAGFRSGYEDVASGSDGCTPAIAPREYWGWRYQSPEGQAKVAAWFAGYPMGAKAAEQDGLANWSQIPTMFTPRAEVPPHLPEDEAMQPLPPTGVPVMTGPRGGEFAPTPLESLETTPLPPQPEINPFSDEAPVLDSLIEGTSAKNPTQPLTMPR